MIPNQEDGLAVSDANRNGGAGMIDGRDLPRLRARLPANSPAGLCPRCLLRLGAALAVDPAGASASGRDRVRRPSGRGSAPLRPTGPPIGAARSAPPASSSPGHCRGPRADPARVARDARPSPARPSRYQLVGEIARGGMGAVLKGRDPDLGRDLAVKVLREEHRDNPELVRRFVEEAQIGGQLQHPGIVPVYELGAFADRRPFFAMKLVKGRTLAALLAARPEPGRGPAAVPRRSSSRSARRWPTPTPGA